jgi:outer membrane cobalamin receptor
VFYYHAVQGLPGAVILYNTQSRQRMWDENVFTQLHYRYDISQQFSYQSNGKMNYSYTRYLDPDYLNAEGKLDNTYRQREYYLSNAVFYKPLKILSLSLANDLSLNNMHASLPDFSNPVRSSSLTSLSGSYDGKKVHVALTVLHTLVSDDVQTGKPGKSYSRFSPSASISCQPVASEEFYVRLFYKNIFRLPTFNDLYYRLVGNIELSPENTHQINIGVSWIKYLDVHLPYFSVSADAYHNRIKDKIIAIPNKNLFVWSMINLGRASITGADVQTTMEIKADKNISFELGLNYAFQQALDVTDKGSKTYKHQIPYTPKHSGSGILSLQTTWLNCSWSVLYVGERYCLGQNVLSNYLSSYFDHSIALYRQFTWGKIQLILRATCLNVLNRQYEVVKSYPMTGRQFQGKIIFKW